MSVVVFLILQPPAALIKETLLPHLLLTWIMAITDLNVNLSKVLKIGIKT